MTLYRVDLVQTVIEETTVYIEANSEAEAKDGAMRKALEGEDVKWHFADCKDDHPEILTVAPVTRPSFEEKWNKGAAAIADALRPD